MCTSAMDETVDRIQQLGTNRIQRLGIIEGRRQVLDHLLEELAKIRTNKRSIQDVIYGFDKSEMVLAVHEVIGRFEQQNKYEREDLDVT